MKANNKVSRRLTTPVVRRLPAEVRRTIQGAYPGIDLRKVRLVSPIPVRIRRRTQVPRPAAVTWRYTIYVEPAYADATTPTGLRVILHELRHMAQWKKYGDSFYPAYAAQGGSVKANPFEADAISFETAATVALRR